MCVFLLDKKCYIVLIYVIVIHININKSVIAIHINMNKNVIINDKVIIIQRR